MSSILIGTVALLLLVVLAGAFVIGTQVASARHDTYATASIAAVAQVSQAATVANNMDPDPTKAGTSAQDLRIGGYLARVPSIPAGAEAVRLIGNDGTPDGVPATVAVMKLASGSSDICKQIAKQDRVSVIDITDEVPAAPSGCFHTTVALKSLEANSLYAYSRI